ncbi:MAG TPA: hypothetical protein VFR90_00440 [Methylibium sp.]|uniref:hypothetical protein n=1 Tax=Methylibium sp. TaxID=2067992 RepID=UPI002DBB0E0E|nr:hypothetical protein [Methylibium sp.]HEU4457572.1 hypothetical protein [Methylibium sp.]
MNEDAGDARPEMGAEQLPALARLQANRERLRRSWIGEPEAPRPEPNPEAQPEAHESWLYRMRGLVETGWSHHPLKATLDNVGAVAGPLANAALRPQVQQHPVRVLAIAAGIGAAIVWVRPWRVLTRAALSSLLLSALLPRRQILRWLLSGGWRKSFGAGAARRTAGLHAPRSAVPDAAPMPPRPATPPGAGNQAMSDSAAPVAASASYAPRTSTPMAADHPAS